MTVPFEITPEALAFLRPEVTDSRPVYKVKEAFINNQGHQLLVSYIEKASLNAVWRLHLPKGTEKVFYALRMTLQRYFMAPRTVSEVCGFMSAPDKSFHDINLVPDINVSIFEYRDEFTKEQVELNDKPPSLARRYLTQDALLRNMSRVAITMRPWQAFNFQTRNPVL